MTARSLIATAVASDFLPLVVLASPEAQLQRRVGDGSRPQLWPAGKHAAEHDREPNRRPDRGRNKTDHAEQRANREGHLRARRQRVRVHATIAAQCATEHTRGQGQTHCELASQCYWNPGERSDHERDAERSVDDPMMRKWIFTGEGELTITTFVDTRKRLVRIKRIFVKK